MASVQVSFNIFDGIVFGILGACALLSLFRGFIREVLSLFAWVGASFFTLYKAEAVTAMIRPSIKSEPAALIIGTLGCYLGALVFISIINAILLRYIKPGKEVGGVDNVLGLFFGLLKGGLIIVLGFFILTIIYNVDTYPDWVKQSWSRPRVEAATKGALPFLPQYLRGLSSLATPEDQEATKATGEIKEDRQTPPDIKGEADKAGDQADQQFQKLLDGVKGATSGAPDSDSGGAKVVRP